MPVASLKRAAWLSCLLVVLTFLVPTSAAAGTATHTGTVDSTSATAKPWSYATIATKATGTLSGTLDWSGTANLDLFIHVRQADGTWLKKAGAVSTTAKPEQLQLTNAPPGTYRFGVRATSGASSFTLTYSYPDPPPDKAYLTLLFSRSEITVADKCVQSDTGVARTDTVVAPELQRRGLRATGTVQTGTTRETGYQCLHNGRTLAASWPDLAALRDTYGWTFVSHSRTYNQNIAALTPEQQWNETCGSQLDLQAHGHSRGDGLFAWPNNKYDVGVQSSIVSSCFAFGRKYRPKPVTRSYVTTAPYWAGAEGISGGKCNDPALACSQLAISRTYESPLYFSDLIRGLQPGQWFVMQSYILVTGERPGLWDCRSTDWRAHWTADAERYCYSDYLTVLDAIPSGVVVTDPKTVAQAWGRTNYTVPSA